MSAAGQTWQNVGGEFGIDPADDSTVFTYRNNSANNTNFAPPDIIGSGGIIPAGADFFAMGNMACDRSTLTAGNLIPIPWRPKTRSILRWPNAA